MFNLIKAKVAARDTIKAQMEKEIKKINSLIIKAKEKGEFFITLNVNEYSRATETLLKKAGYEICYDKISWAKKAIELEANEKEILKIAREAGIEVVDVMKLSKGNS